MGKMFSDPGSVKVVGGFLSEYGCFYIVETDRERFLVNNNGGILSKEDKDN